MPEFQAWQHSDIKSRERLLWIRGALGIGKTVMAGYFIDLLKEHDPTAIVMYFFCKSGRPGLTKARDIVRTLMYQYYLQSDHAVRSTLESLQLEEFKIDSLAMRILCEKLLLEPLEQPNKNIYIVVDGVDEADKDSMDLTEPNTRELDILIAQLAAARTAHVLFISKPEANIAQAVPAVVIRSIDRMENKGDVNAYVTQTIAQSEGLRSHFAEARVDPLEYFDEKAKGIFLWVAAVLKQLEKIRFSTTFGQELDSWAEASGDMDKLYSKILASYDDEARMLLKDILSWVVVSFDYLDLPTLKSFVQCSLKTPIPTFQEFVEVECGSILHLRRDTSTEVTFVELIHDTFLSYLLDPRRCSESFHIDEAVAHATIFRVCLTVLSDVDPLFSAEMYEYAAMYWFQHQFNAIGSKFSVESVSTICTFFCSEGCKQWLKYLRPSLWPRFPGPILDQSEIQVMAGIVILEINKWFETGEVVPPPEIEGALNLIADPGMLVEYLGKGATQLWLYEDLPLDKIQLTFRVALWCFCRRRGLGMDSIEKLQSIAVNDFAIIRAWLGNRPAQIVSKKKLGIAYGVLRLWDRAATYLEALEEMDITKEIKECLVVSLMESGLYNRVIKVIASLDPHSASFKLNYKANFLLGCAYKANGDLDGAIAAFEASGATLIVLFPITVIRLHQLYADKGDIEGIIKMYERVVGQYSYLWWGWQLLSVAYIAAGEIEKCVDVYQRALAEKNETVKAWASEGLRKVDLNKGIENFERNDLSGIHPGTSMLTHRRTRFRGRLDAKYLATGSFGYTRIFDVLTGMKVLALLEEGSTTFPTVCTINVVCFSPDGRCLATAGGCGEIRIWDLEQGCILARLWPGHKGSVTSLDYSPTGDFLVSASNDGAVKLWDMTSTACLFDLPLPQQFCDLSWNTVAFSQDEMVIGASAKSGHVFIWESANGTWENPEELNLAQCPWNEESEAFVAFQGERTGRFCRIGDGMGLFEPAHKNDASNQFPHLPRSLPTLKTTTEWPGTWCSPTSVGWSADNLWIISGDCSGSVQCWDEYGQVQFTLYAHSTGTENRIARVSVAHARAGNIFATAVTDCVRIWQYRTMP